jgi:hypothetical protein
LHLLPHLFSDMSHLLKVISDWRNGRSAKECDFRDLFKQHLHKPPYYLRYSLDKQRPDLFMIYITDYSNRDEDLVQECNGIIVDSRDYSIVAYGMNRMLDKTKDYHSGQFRLPEGEDYRYEEAEDGAVLSVFQYEGSWVVSTKRNIDAKNVRWSSQKNFYQLLGEAFPNNDPQTCFQKDLQSGYTYSFILLHPENHLVIPHSKIELLYISRRNNTTLEEENMATDEPGKNHFDWASSRQIMNRESCLKRLSEHRGKVKRGIICYRKTLKSVQRIMIDYKWFNEANELRKGMPSLHLSYLACSPEEKQKMRQYFGNQHVFNQMDDLLRNLIRYTYAVYRDSYVRKQFKVLPDDPIYKTIRKLHNEFKTTGQPIRIHHVVNVIESIPAHILDSILSYFSAYGFYRPGEPPDLTDTADPGSHHDRHDHPKENVSSFDKSCKMPARIDDEDVHDPVLEYEGM